MAYTMCTSYMRIKIATAGQSNTSFTLLPLGHSVLSADTRSYEVLSVCLNIPKL